MPVYEYQCKNCDYQFEENQSFSEPALRTCPKCKTDSLKKLYSAVGIVFKGSGFYKNDSKSTSVPKGDNIGVGSDKSVGNSSSSTAEVTKDKSTSDKSSSDKSTGDKSTGDKSGKDVSSVNSNTNGKGSKTKGELSSTGSKSTS